MSRKEHDKWAYSIPGKLALNYIYYLGDFNTKFFTELRDNKKILGVKCPKCNRVYMPPRPVCGRCLSKLDEWVELSDKGTLLSYTVVNYSEPYQPAAPPIIYGIIKLDGADTGFTHLLGEVDAEKLRIGMRVQAVFKDKREASIQDIKYFKPI